VKIWIKYTIGIILGLALGFIFPDNQDLLAPLADFVIRLGQYAVFPLIFFSAAQGVYRLRESRKGLRVSAQIGGYIIFNTFVILLLGALTVLIINPRRVPIITKEVANMEGLNWISFLEKLVPANSFGVFLGGASGILPLLILSVMIGLHFNFDKHITIPGREFFDSMSRIFYQMNSLIVEILSLGMVVLSMYYLMQWNTIEDLSAYWQIILIGILFTLFIIGVLYPAVIYFFQRGENPYRKLAGISASLMAALISGNAFFSYGTMVRQSRENLGVPRKVGSLQLPFHLLFGRPGTAVITAMGFFVILRSYSSLEITVFQFMWTLGFSFLISFALPFHSFGASYFALSLLCGLYGRGMEEGFLNLQPILFVLSSLGAVMDVAAASLSGFFIAHKEKMLHKVNPKYYI